MADTKQIRASINDYNTIIEFKNSNDLSTITETLTFLLKKAKRAQILENTIKNIHFQSKI